MKFFLIIYLTISLMSSAFSLEKVEINGNKRLSNETIQVYGKISNYDNFNDFTLNQIIKNLYETGFFENVKVSFENDI